MNDTRRTGIAGAETRADVAVAARRPRPAAHVRRTVTVLLGAVALMLAIHLLPEPAPLERGGNIIPLTVSGKACLAIMAFAVTLWVTETLPFAATGLLILLLVPAFGITDFRSVVRAGFGDAVIAFFLGVLILSAGFTSSGLGTRLAYQVLARVGARPDRVLFGFLLVGSLLSWWVTDMACAAMLLPIALGITRDAGLQPGRSNFGRALFIAVAFGPLIGGIATPAGTAANIVALAQLNQLAGVNVTFTRWMVLGVPAALLMLPMAWWILRWMFPPEFDRLPMSDAEIRGRLAALGPLSPVERHTLAAFAGAVALWTLTPLLSQWTDGRFAPPVEAVALGAGLYLFLPGVRVLSWKQAEANIEWGGLTLIAAGLSLGLVVYETGAARWLAWVLLGEITSVPGPLVPFVIVLAVAALHMLFSSNTVTATIIVPILVALAQDLGLNVWAVVAPAAFTSSLAFILVTEGPTTLIPYAAGYFSIKDMAKAGIIMTVGAAMAVALTQYLFRLLGVMPAI
ncbi:MAG: DASS family sodium-coupled anion symporter [Acidobacteria bacterium]|nr:DASS family sodium-coupled anion symporter [Acidobacteriota bacterium]